MRPSYVYNGNPSNGEAASLYWSSPYASHVWVKLVRRLHDSMAYRPFSAKPLIKPFADWLPIGYPYKNLRCNLEMSSANWQSFYIIACLAANFIFCLDGRNFIDVIFESILLKYVLFCTWLKFSWIWFPITSANEDPILQRRHSLHQAKMRYK